MTIGVNTPFAGHALDVVRNQSIPLAGGSLTQGQYVGNYSVRRERSRIGTGSPGPAEGLTGHVVDGIAVIEVSGPDGTRWVVGNIQFRTTEEIPGQAPRFAIRPTAAEDGTIPEEPETDEPYAGFGPEPRIHKATLVSHIFDLGQLLAEMRHTESAADLASHLGNAAKENQVMEKLGKDLADRIALLITKIRPLEQARIVIRPRKLTRVELDLAQRIAIHLRKQVIIYTPKYGNLITLCP